MAKRYFVPDVTRGSKFLMGGAEAHHLRTVARALPGDRVVVFDGTGVEYKAIVENVGKQTVMLKITDKASVNRELPFHLELACSLPKGNRQRWLIEKATEFGVTRLVPLITEYTGAQGRSTRRDKVHRWIIAASKQCGRNVLMELSDPLMWSDYLLSVPDSTYKLLADPEGRPLQLKQKIPMKYGVVVAIGPEGGFASAEIDLAISMGWTQVGFGPRILRVESAALALISVLAVCAPSLADRKSNSISRPKEMQPNQSSQEDH